MAMEKSQRRMHVISSHLEADAHSTPLIASAVCRAVYGSGLEDYRRKDNMLDFARQGSESQSPFMRQSSFNQETNEQSENVITPPLSTTLDLKSDSLPQKPPSPMRGSLGVSKDLASDAPCFPYQSKAVDQKSKIVSLQIQRQRNSGDYYGFEWQPRMDMLEAIKEYLVTVEVPGVDPDGIRVEVDAHWLIVSGTRPSQLSSNQKTNVREAFFHHRELAYGPFKAMCHIPGNTNMDAIAAEITYQLCSRASKSILCPAKGITLESSQVNPQRGFASRAFAQSRHVNGLFTVDLKGLLTKKTTF